MQKWVFYQFYFDVATQQCISSAGLRTTAVCKPKFTQFVNAKMGWWWACDQFLIDEVALEGKHLTPC
jgi:hypothetical protein